MGLYYLQSRYYNPEVGRFLNADALISTGQGVLGNNMFAYCGNNPVSRVDATGCAFVQINYNLDGLPNDLFPDIGGGCAVGLVGAGVVVQTVKAVQKVVNNTSEAVVQQQLKTYGVSFYKGVPVCMTELMPNGSAFSLGIIVMDDFYETATPSYFSNVIKHEYGHRVHMDQIGVPTYLLTVGIPSATFAGLSRFSTFIKKNYESLPWENIAEQLGNVNGTYLPGAETAASAYWVYTLYISQILRIVWG